jgi:hypothetical protein
MATAMVIALAVVLNWLPQQGEPPGVRLAQPGLDQMAGDLEMLSRDEPLELYRDLEFYYWLEQEGAHAG